MPAKAFMASLELHKGSLLCQSAFSWKSRQTPAFFSNGVSQIEISSGISLSGPSEVTGEDGIMHFTGKRETTVYFIDLK